MTLKTLAAASYLTVAMATSTIAAPVIVDVAFDDVTATFYGLDDADNKASATHFDLSFPGEDGPRVDGSYRFSNIDASSAYANQFYFESGILPVFHFIFKGEIYDDDNPWSLYMVNMDFWHIAGFQSSAIIDTTSGCCIVNPGYAPFTIEISPVAAVPLPAGGLLLLTAFGGVAALKRRKKRAA